MIKKYSTELEGQKEFYNDYLPLINRSLTIDDVFQYNTDGVLNGNILEFKLNINDLNAVLFQTIKYLSSMRIKGKPIPANIILISLNDGIAYIYKSETYLSNIETLYTSSASKDNVGFIAKPYFKKLEYVNDMLAQSNLIDLLKENNYTKINIDENCIVGWATKYYTENPTARKADFIGDIKGKVKIIGEIREPNKFKEYIYPYKGETNTKFQYLMDKLNDDLQKKNLGAFYTHPLYARKSLELVREAIKRVPKGNDYVIIDRCAGTGNLEKYLTDEELSHIIVSTIEYYEYKVLHEVLGDKVRRIIPPTEMEDTFNMGLVRGADTLTKEIIKCVRDSANLYTDEYLGYNRICQFYMHAVVRHKLSQYVDGNAFTNNIEGFWSIVKRSLLGIYHFTSKKHLQKYLDEFVFRYNTKEYSESDRVVRFLTNMTVRTRYKDLIAA